MLARSLPLVCLLLSGFAGLVYEVCWIRQGTLVFGSSTVATSTVLAVFFAGLALGGLLFGRLSARLQRPFRTYALIEAGVAALGLASVALFPIADSAYGAAYRALAEGSPVLGALRLVLVSAVLLPAATLMGATLPVFCAGATTGGGRAPVALWYAINTLGAAAGALAAGLLLIPSIGVTRSIALAAAANGLAAALALRIAIPVTPHVASPAPAAPARPTKRPDAGRKRHRVAEPEPSAIAPTAWMRPALSTLFFLGGFVALAHEVLWTRYLGLLLRNTVYTFTISLTVVLVGIVIGSMLVSRERSPARGRAVSGVWLFGALQILIGLAVLTTMLLPPDAWHRLGTGLAVYAALLLPAAVLSGASFPVAVRLVTEAPARLGYEVGRVAALNIAGGIAGSLWAGFIGLPRLGLQASLLVTTGLSVGVGIAAWLLPRPGARRARDLVLAAAAVAAWLIVPRALGTRVPADFLAADGPLLAYREGVLSNVAVIREGDVVQMRIDRWWQGQDRKTHQIMAAHLPMLLHRDPHRVLVVGAGTGQTASRFLMYPVEQLEVVDLEPVVFDMIRPYFDHAWMNDPRVRLLRDDGRNVLDHTARTFDVISLEVGQVFRPGVASFYTREFYRRARARLRPGGLICQFVPLPFLTVDQFRGVVATFLDVFPQSTLWYNTSELLLIGARDAAPSLAASRLALLASDARIRADLAYSHTGGPSTWLNQPRELVGTFLAGPSGLERMSRGAARYEDDRPVLEYATTQVDEWQSLDVAIASYLKDFLDSPGAVLEVAAPAGSLAAFETARRRNLAAIEAGVLIRQATLIEGTGRHAEIEALLERAVRIHPGSLSAHRGLGTVAQRSNRPEEARRHFEDALRIDPRDVGSLRGLATWHLEGRRFEDARRLFETVLELRPQDADAHNNLGVTLASQGDVPAALAHFQEAVRLAPGDAGARQNLARAQASLGTSTGGTR